MLPLCSLQSCNSALVPIDRISKVNCSADLGRLQRSQKWYVAINFFIIFLSPNLLDNVKWTRNKVALEWISNFKKFDAIRLLLCLFYLPCYTFPMFHMVSEGIFVDRQHNQKLNHSETNKVKKVFNFRVILFIIKLFARKIDKIIF